MEKNISVDITAPERYLLKTTRRVGMTSYKSAQVRFDHRTLIQGVQIPSWFPIYFDQELFREFFQFFTSDGNQSLKLTTLVNANFEDDPWPTQPQVPIAIEYELAAGGSKWWNDDLGEWVDEFYASRFDMTDTELGDGFLSYQVFVSIQTANFPAEPGAGLRFTFYIARSQDEPEIPSIISIFNNTEVEIENPILEEGRATAIDYRLTQVTDAKGRYNDGAVWFGDGPTLYARSAITRDQAGEELTSAWRYGNETAGASSAPIVHAHISLREVMDMKRMRVRGLVADLLGKYKPCQVVNVDSSFHFFIGGNQSGRDNIWHANLFRINRQPVIEPVPIPFEIFGAQDGGGTLGNGRFYRDTNFTGNVTGAGSTKTNAYPTGIHFNNRHEALVTGRYSSRGGYKLMRPMADNTAMEYIREGDMWSFEGSELGDEVYYYFAGDSIFARRIRNNEFVWRRRIQIPGVFSTFTPLMHIHAQGGYMWLMNQRGSSNALDATWFKIRLSDGVILQEVPQVAQFRVVAFDIHRINHRLAMRVYDPASGIGFSIRLVDGHDFSVLWDYSTTGSTGIPAAMNQGLAIDENNKIYATWSDGGSPGSGQVCLDMEGNVIWDHQPGVVSARSLALVPQHDFYYSYDGNGSLRRMSKLTGQQIEALGATPTQGFQELVAVGGRLAKFVPNLPPRPVPPPDNFGAEQIGHSAPKDVKFVWDAVPGADGYDLFVKLPGGEFTKQNPGLIPGATTEYTVQNLAAGEYYAYMTTWKDGQSSPEQFIMEFEVVDWPENVYFQDFSKYQINDHYNVPPGWTYRYGSSAHGSFDVEQGPGFLGGKALAWTPPGTSIARRGLTWTELGLVGTPQEVPNVEMEAKFLMRIAFTGRGPFLLFRGGTATTVSGIVAGFGAGDFMKIGRYTSGSFAEIASKSFTRQRDVWYRVKAQVNGDDVKMKMWRDEDPEPVDWDLEETQTFFQDAGHAGFVVDTPSHVIFDWVKVTMLPPDPGQEMTVVYGQPGEHTFNWMKAGFPEEIDVLVVGGGGGGGSRWAGGAGGGGQVVFAADVEVSGNVPIVVGDGGLGATTSAADWGQVGQVSSFGSMEAIGGGGGGPYLTSGDVSGTDGASGGGAGLSDTISSGGTGLQGNDGGGNTGDTTDGAGGGGGAGEVGEAGSDIKGGNGGDGVDLSAIFPNQGDSGWFGGGGGGGRYAYLNSVEGGYGGQGGGGNAGRAGDTTGADPGQPGMANTGGGGGGASGSRTLNSIFMRAGGKGGSGVVIVRYNTGSEET